MTRSNNSSKGFTIIEVVLVLAIAGLIFLVVFLALPALQRSQRDTQRKSDLGKFMSQVTSYQSNNQGTLPAAANWGTTFLTGYLTVNNQAYADPQTGNTYTLTQQAGGAGSNANPPVGNIYIYINARCDPTTGNGLAAGAGNRNFAAKVFQEQGTYACQSN
jgi:prepilin-type N-terminal cleavage/methylation domain-containing protein